MNYTRNLVLECDGTGMRLGGRGKECIENFDEKTFYETFTWNSEKEIGG
jgi:hypothetical protein